MYNCKPLLGKKCMRINNAKSKLQVTLCIVRTVNVHVPQMTRLYALHYCRVDHDVLYKFMHMTISPSRAYSCMFLQFSEYSEEVKRNGSNYWIPDTTSSHAKEAQDRIKEFTRLQKARHLLDAVSLLNDLLADGSEVETLSLASTIVRRMKMLGVACTMSNKENGFSNDTRSSALRHTHSGIYHCCTFCSSGGKKEAVCGCRGTMPGGYRGCGHGHIGHPGVHHWSCCGSVLRYGRCLLFRKCMYQMLL